MWTRFKHWFQRRPLPEITDGDVDATQRKRLLELARGKETKQEDNYRPRNGFFHFGVGGLRKTRTGSVISRRQKVSSCEESSVKSIRVFPGGKVSRTVLEEERPDVVGSVTKTCDQTRRRSLLTSGEVWVHAPQDQSDVDRGVPGKTSGTEFSEDEYLASYPPLMRRRQKNSFRLGFESSRKRNCSKQDWRSLKHGSLFGTDYNDSVSTHSWRAPETENCMEGKEDGRSCPNNSERHGINGSYLSLDPAAYEGSPVIVDGGRTSVRSSGKEKSDLISCGRCSAAIERGYVTLKDLETQLASNTTADEILVGVTFTEEPRKPTMTSRAPNAKSGINNCELSQSEKSKGFCLGPVSSELSLLNDAPLVRVTLSLKLENKIRRWQSLKPLPSWKMELDRIPGSPVDVPIIQGRRTVSLPPTNARTLNVKISELLGTESKSRRCFPKYDFSLDKTSFLLDIGERKRRSSSVPERSRISASLRGTLEIQILEKEWNPGLDTSPEIIGRGLSAVTIEPTPGKISFSGSEKSVQRLLSRELEKIPLLGRRWKSECQSLETREEGGIGLMVEECYPVQRSPAVRRLNDEYISRNPVEKNFQGARRSTDNREFRRNMDCLCSSKQLRSGGEFSRRDEPDRARGVQFKCRQETDAEVHRKKNDHCQCYEGLSSRHKEMRCQCNNHQCTYMYAPSSQSEHTLRTDTKLRGELETYTSYRGKQTAMQCHCYTNQRTNTECQWRRKNQSESLRDHQRYKKCRDLCEVNSKSPNCSAEPENVRTDDSSSDGIIWTVCNDCRHRDLLPDNGLEAEAASSFQLSASETRQTPEVCRNRNHRFSAPSPFTYKRNCPGFTDDTTEGTDGTMSDLGERSSNLRLSKEVNLRRRVSRAVSGSPPPAETTPRSTSRTLSNWTNTIPLRKRLSGKVFGRRECHASSTCISQPVTLCRTHNPETGDGSSLSVNCPVNRGFRDFNTGYNSSPVNVCTRSQVAKGDTSCYGNSLASVFFNVLSSNGDKMTLIRRCKGRRHDNGNSWWLRSESSKKIASQLQNCDWYWGCLGLEEAEALLADQIDGRFLVRDSSDAKYVLSLSFRSLGSTHHTRIEYSKGLFRFYSKTKSRGASTITKFIEDTMAACRTGQNAFYLRSRGPGLPPAPVHLLYPLSKPGCFESLEHLSKWAALPRVRHDMIDSVLMPKVKDYLNVKQSPASQNQPLQQHRCTFTPSSSYTSSYYE